MTESWAKPSKDCLARRVLPRFAMFVRFRGRQVAVILALPIFGPAFGCRSDLVPCFSLKAGDQIALSIVEPYDANSHYTFVGGLNVPAYPCELGVDVSDGETIAATVTDFGAGPDTGCATAVPAYGPVGDWIWQLRPDQMPPEAFLFGVYTATRSSCVGTVQVRLSSDNMPFAASVEGQVPHLIMERDFAADANNPDCPNVPTAMVDAAGNLSCGGYFVVNASLAAP
jgi:hypothetical protein